jgi:hypothetical protein
VTCSNVVGNNINLNVSSKSFLFSGYVHKPNKFIEGLLKLNVGNKVNTKIVVVTKKARAHCIWGMIAI